MPSDNTENNRLLVAISHKTQSINLLIKAKQLSEQMNAPLQAVHIETLRNTTETDKQQLQRNIETANNLGIPTRIITDFDIVKGIIRFAIQEGITHIIVGKQKQNVLNLILRQHSFASKLNQLSEGIHIYWLSTSAKKDYEIRPGASKTAFSSDWTDYVITTICVLISIFGLYVYKDSLGYRAVSYLLLLEVSAMAFKFGTGPVLVASALSALFWNFLFLPPQFTLHIENTEDVLMFVLFFTIALLNGVLTSQIRNREFKIRKREEITQILYNFSKQIADISNAENLKKATSDVFTKLFKCESILFFNDDISTLLTETMPSTERKLALWCYENSKVCGKFSDHFQESDYTYFPLSGLQTKTGVIGLKLTKQLKFEEKQHLDAVMVQISGKLERAIVSKIAQKAELLDASDRLYKTLFNSISHEFRIPVTTIMGASDTLMTENYPDEIKFQLFNEINIASIRLNNLIENLLNMSRLESGSISVRPDWYDVHDLINKVKEGIRQELDEFNFIIEIPDNFPLIRVDFGLIEQVLHNLLLNATQYSENGSTINLSFKIEDMSVLQIKVADNGPGIPEKDCNVVFEKFYRAHSMRTGGTGLGLSIAKGFAEAHKGEISAYNLPQGGACFVVKIPTEISDIEQLSNKIS